MHLIWRVLTFRATRDELLALEPKHLYWGFFWTWLAGMGRYWDNPKAVWAQQLGLGSVVYVFVLAGIIWIIIAPLSRHRFEYRNLLTYITMTAPPAVLYAIPVERFMTMEQAASTNVWFLALVATWRVTLYWRYLRLVPAISTSAKFLAGIMPLASIVFVLMMLNLEHAVFEIMGGIQEKTANDAAYGVVWILGVFSMFAAPLLLIAWIALIYSARKEHERSLEIRS